jgi:hypothetical protein
MMKRTEQQNQTIDQAEEAAYQTEETITFTQHLLLGFIISADNEKYTEEQKQEVIKRYDEARKINKYDWNYILQPVDDTGKLVKLLNNGD